jgi:hypothetical protein
MMDRVLLCQETKYDTTQLKQHIYVPVHFVCRNDQTPIHVHCLHMGSIAAKNIEGTAHKFEIQLLI